MPVTVQNVSLLNGHMYALAVIDQNGNKAHANTPFYQTPSGIMLPAPSDALGNPITAAQGIAPTFTQNTGTIASTNTATSFTLALGSLAMGTGLYDARQATVRINNSGTAQTITQVQLVLQDNVGGATIPVTYTVGSLSIASGATDVFTIPLTSGLASTANLIVTFGTAPVAGEVYVSVNFQGAGSGQMSFTGSSATLPVSAVGTTAAILPSPGEVFLVGGNSGVAAQTIAASASYNVSYSKLLGHNEFITAAAVSGQTSWGLYANQFLLQGSAAIGQGSSGVTGTNTTTPSQIVYTAGVTVTVQNNNTTTAMTLNILSVAIN